MSGDTSGVLQLASNGSTTAVTIDTSQNVGIGTTSPSYKLDVNKGSNGVSARFGNGTNYYYTYSDGSGNYLTADTSINTAIFMSPTASGVMTFLTANTERMRIDSSGNLLVGGTTAGAKVRIETNLAPQDGLDIKNTVNNTGNTFVGFYNYNSVIAGSITQPTATTVVYGATSDYRLKTVLGAISGAGERIDALKPISYQWKEDNTKASGFLAHEFQSVYPNSVSGDKDAVDTNGNPKYQTMQASTSEVIADLVTEIQSLRQRLATIENKSDTQAETINALTARIVALEAK
jgi:hypothetical protein